MVNVNTLNVKIFADGADVESIKQSKKIPFIKGFTTNPTLMRQAGVTDYEAFAKEALEIVEGLPISFEVFSDDLDEMGRQARKIASWGPNVNVKIPITNSKGKSTVKLVKSLSDEGIICNVTAIFTLLQVQTISDALNPLCEAIISIFAGRIADTGVDPMPIMNKAVAMAKSKPKASVLWASPREALNIIQALLQKISSFNKDLGQFSLETVQMFYNDARASGYSLSDDETQIKYSEARA